MARLRPSPLRPEERRTTVIDPDRDGMRLQIRTPGDLQTLEFIAAERRAPDAGRDRGGGQRVEHQLRRRAGRVRPLPDLRRQAARTGPGFRRGGHRGRSRRHRPTRSGPGRRLSGPADAGAPSSPATPGWPRRCLPGCPTRRPPRWRPRYATAWFGLHDLARIGAGDRVLIHSAHRRCRAGRDRDRPAGRSARSSPPPAAPAAASCCATWASSTSMTRAQRISPTRSAATPTATALTWCSTR